MTGPLMLIVIGVLFLLNNLFPGQFSFGRMWPVILIVIGLAKVFEYLQGTPEIPAKPRDNLSNGPVSAANHGNAPEKKEGM